MTRTLIIALLVLLPVSASAEFTLQDEDGRVTVQENGAPVAVYNYAPVAPVGKPRAATPRACYLHPVYGLGGEVLTDDFPLDHLHHRGIFWAWPRCTVNGREMDVWSMKGARQQHESFVEKSADAERAVLAVTNVWRFDDMPEQPVLREHVRMTFLPAKESSRVIQIELRLENLSGGDFVLGGQTDADKGYGGVCVRPAGGSGKFSEDESNSPFRFIGKDGVIDEDRFEADTPWCAVLLASQPDKPRAGLALAQHPENPGYPHPGWLLRHYGFLGHSWPHRQPHVIPMGGSVTLRYTALVTRGVEDAAGFEYAFASPSRSGS